MAKRYVHLDLPHPTSAELIRRAFDHLRTEMQIPLEFPDQVLTEAQRVAELDQEWPQHSRNYLDLDFITIDPEDSMDLDQAMHLAATESGFVVHYAIADVAAFVAPGGAIDLEAQSRGMTLYAPEGRTPLHPPLLSEGAASLLPGQIRPAAMWRIELDHAGQVTESHVERALVRSADRISYVAGQRVLEEYEVALPQHVTNGDAQPVSRSVREQILTAAGVSADFCAQGFESLLLLRQVGPLRETIEHDRGGVSLNVPEQEVAVDSDGGFALEFRSVSAIEDWNAQISLLTGVVAAQIMLRGGVGFVRTLPQADPRDLSRLRRMAQALELTWAQEMDYATFIKTLDGANPRHAAFLFEATSLFRGAGYLAFDTSRLGPIPGEEETKHHAIGANYAHVTAPLRRLADRYAAEICLALCAGESVPQWVVSAMDSLPATMAGASRRSGSYTRAGVDIVEAALLAPLEGQEFGAVVIERDAKDPTRGEIMIAQPAVRAQVRGHQPLPLGESITVQLTEADLDKRRIRFTQA